MQYITQIFLLSHRSLVTFTEIFFPLEKEHNPWIQGCVYLT